MTEPIPPFFRIERFSSFYQSKSLQCKIRSEFHLLILSPAFLSSDYWMSSSNSSSLWEAFKPFTNSSLVLDLFLFRYTFKFIDPAIPIVQYSCLSTAFLSCHMFDLPKCDIFFRNKFLVVQIDTTSSITTSLSTSQRWNDMMVCFCVGLLCLTSGTH